MELPASNMIEIDRGEKKVTITNNRPLYRAIKSGAVVPLAFGALEALSTVVECVDPLIGWLTRALEAAYLYHVYEWTVGHVVTGSAHAVGSAVGTATPTLK